MVLHHQQIVDKFVTELPAKRKDDDESTPNMTPIKTKTREYDEAYLTVTFTVKMWRRCTLQ